jgi:hypothetical protein
MAELPVVILEVQAEAGTLAELAVMLEWVQRELLQARTEGRMKSPTDARVLFVAVAAQRAPGEHLPGLHEHTEDG